MEIGKIVGIALPEHIEDKLEVFLAEYLTELGQKRMLNHPEDLETFDKVKDLVFKATPNKDEAETLLNDRAEIESNAQGDYYLYGLRDGIKIMLSIMTMR